MIIERCGDQKSKSLDAFYAELASGSAPGANESGLAMLELLAALRNHADSRRVWGLTSLARLCLLAQDTYKSPWYVIVAALDHRNYFIEYLMPEKDAPWADAYVKGEARSLDEAVRLTIVAMERSQGWPAGR